MDATSSLLPVRASVESTKSASLSTTSEFTHGFRFGSLPRPPESCLISCSCRNSTILVCLWPHIAFANLSVAAVDAGLRRLEVRYFHRQGKNLNFVVDSYCLDLCGDSFYGSLLLDYLACGIDDMMLMSFGGLHMIAPPYGDSFIGFFAFEDAEMVQRLSFFVRFSFGDIATILVAVDSRFIPLEIAILFSAFVLHSSCSSTSLMLLRKTEFQSHIHQLLKEQFISSNWLVYCDMCASLNSVPSHGELCYILEYAAMPLTLPWFASVNFDGQQVLHQIQFHLWVQSQEFDATLHGNGDKYYVEQRIAFDIGYRVHITGPSRVFQFIGQIVAASFGLVKIISYVLLRFFTKATRPFSMLSVLIPSNTHEVLKITSFFFKSKMKVSFHLEGEY